MASRDNWDTLLEIDDDMRNVRSMNEFERTSDETERMKSSDNDRLASEEDNRWYWSRVFQLDNRRNEQSIELRTYHRRKDAISDCRWHWRSYRIYWLSNDVFNGTVHCLSSCVHCITRQRATSEYSIESQSAVFHSLSTQHIIVNNDNGKSTLNEALNLIDLLTIYSTNRLIETTIVWQSSMTSTVNRSRVILSMFNNESTNIGNEEMKCYLLCNIRVNCIYLHDEKRKTNEIICRYWNNRMSGVVYARDRYDDTALSLEYSASQRLVECAIGDESIPTGTMMCLVRSRRRQTTTVRILSVRWFDFVTNVDMIRSCDIAHISFFVTIQQLCN
jgi:hypothetical protein